MRHDDTRPAQSRSGPCLGQRPAPQSPVGTASGAGRRRHAGFGRADRFARVGLFVGLLTATFLSACGGGSYIRMNLLRDVAHEKPVYVGVYFLSQESAIDAASIPDLIDNPEQFADGVVARQVFPVYPGEIRPLPLENYDPAIRWVALVADFGSDAECARAKTPVSPGAKLDLQVSLEADCLRLEVR